MKLNFKEKYLIFLVILCFIVVGLYYSYAIFVTKQLQENVVVIKIDNKALNLKIDGKDNKITLEGNSEKTYNITLENNNGMDYKYLVLFKKVKTGVKVSSESDTEGIIKSRETRNLVVKVNNTLNEKIELEFIAKISNKDIIDKDIEYSYIKKDESFDHSNANKPDLNGLNLVPVIYNKTSDTEGVWIKADITNKNSLWYDYDNGIWANAVLLNNNNYNKYKNKDVGTEIELGDISGFYVWIPRFKYYIINNSNYTNYERITNVVFEKEKESTGTITCTDKISTKEDKHIYSEVCSDNIYNHIYDNLSTYTHPSFKDQSGFWVAKFLMGEGEKVLPNINILKKDITGASDVSKHVSNSHVLTNMEYGAVLLLANSSYGKTGNKMYTDKNAVFSRIYVNAYAYDLTGCSSEYNIYSKNFITSDTKKCIEYNNLVDLTHVSNSVNYMVGYAGAGASSTGTVYGVYDLANKNGEIVSAYVLDENGSITTNLKYYDKYSYSDYVGKVASSSSVYNLYRYKLGDGIKEHFRSFNQNGMWHSGALIQNKNSGILVRGGNGDITNASVYTTSIEGIDYVAPFRLVLISN